MMSGLLVLVETREVGCVAVTEDEGAEDGRSDLPAGVLSVLDRPDAADTNPNADVINPKPEAAARCKNVFRFMRDSFLSENLIYRNLFQKV